MKSIIIFLTWLSLLVTDIHYRFLKYQPTTPSDRRILIQEAIHNSH